MSNVPEVDVLFSMVALRRAWRQVRRNGESPGSDGQKPEDFEANLDTELNRLRQHLLNGMYRPQPVRRYYVKKANGKERPISIWAVRDRVVQRVVLDYLTAPLEAIFLPCSYGFRLGRSVRHAVEAVDQARKVGLVWVLDADIADCFGSIPLNPLLGQVRRIVGDGVVVDLIDAWLNTSVHAEKGKIAGVSQGGVISPHLANLYLHRFDEMIVAAISQGKLVRFADDFIILSRSEDEAVWSLDVARRSLENLRLSLNMRKTRIVHFEEGFTFLGATFKGDGYQLPNGREA